MYEVLCFICYKMQLEGLAPIHPSDSLALFIYYQEVYCAKLL